MLTLSFTPESATVNGESAPAGLFYSYVCTVPCVFTIEYCLLDVYQNLDGLLFHLSYDAATHAFRIAQD